MQLGIVERMAPAPAPLPERTVEFRFTGQAGEYFRIWIVNVLLSIVTLGIYSAWAKVRTKQYFYRNTWMDDSSFEYLADPVAILKGRILAAAALGLLFASQYFSTALYIAGAIALTLAAPWVFTKMLAFNARNSAYRNVRFGFQGGAGAAYGVYLIGLLVYVATCGLGMPYFQWRMSQFAAQNHVYGLEPFQWRTTVGDYFRVYGIAVLISIPVYVALLGAVVVLTRMIPDGGDSIAALIVLPVYAALLIPAAYIKANIANALYNGLNVGPHSLGSNQKTLELLKLYVSNLLAVVFTLGLATPWALVRLARYRASCTSLTIVGTLETENNDLIHDQKAYGDAAADLGDFDFELG